VPESEVVTVTIDGHTIEASKGMSVLEAAKIAGIRIPYYCYHPGLAVVGSCRMCLVEIEKIPKLQPSCATRVSHGMVVRTQTPEAIRNRRSVLEFLLTNHPLDCPVCDQSGECELQNYYMDHGLYDTRFNENKTKRKKAYTIGPHVILDQERCILCTRCVRFTRDITRTCELGVNDRGHRSQIDVFPGIELANPYSANVVDLCPVGALTDRDFRFQCRVWFLGRTPSICPCCSRGCNIQIHYNERFDPRYHDRRIERLKPRYNKYVNRYWMCDEGRYSYRSIDAHNRLKAPMMRTPEGYRELSWEDAVRKVARALTQALEQHGPQDVALLASPKMSNEELFRLRRLFRDSLEVHNVHCGVTPIKAAYSDQFLVTADRNPNTRGAGVLELTAAASGQLLRLCGEGRIRFLYLCQDDLTQEHDTQQVRAALGKVDFVVFQGSWDSSTAALADIQLPSAVCAEKEGTFVNVDGRVQKFHAAVAPLGKSLPDLDILCRLARELEVQLPAASATEVFLEISQQVEEFSGMTYQTLGENGQMLKSNGVP